MKLLPFRCTPSLLAGLVAVLLLCSARINAQTSTVTVDPTTTYQTIRGWGCVADLRGFLNPDYTSELFYEVVNEFGLNRLRFGIPGGNSSTQRRFEFPNDNSDPLTMDWPSLNLADFDLQMNGFVVPFAALVQANGELFDSYLSFSFYNTGSTGAAPPWLLYSYGEYAEYITSALSRMKHYYGIEPSYMVITNEPTYDNNFTAQMVTDLVKFMGPKLEASGLNTRIQYPEALNIDMAYNTFVLPYLADSELWSWISLISYHRYGGATQSVNLATFAQDKGLQTAFTETGTASLDLLYTDMTTMNASAWEIFGLGSAVNLDDQHFNYYEPTANSFYWRFRQVFHYVRPGAVRVATTTSDATAKIMAWEKDGKSILNIYNLTNKILSISGLKPGTYGLSSARLSAAYVEQGVYTIPASGILNLTVPDAAPLYTLYPRPAANLPPVFTSFKPSVPYLALPSSSFTLSAAAQDPDKNAVSFQWGVTSSPAAASVTLSTANNASCLASGLTVPGDYTFTVTASDGTGSTRRRVFMRVYAGSPPPSIWKMQTVPPQVFLPATSTNIRAQVWNVDADALTLQWSIVTQPPGANAQFTTPTATTTDVTAMTVPGTYLFNVSVSDGTTTVSGEHTVTVYPLNTTPTVSASASPASITLPTSTTILNSTSADADGHQLTHWWRCASRPAGAFPNLVSPSLSSTPVTGLIVPGTYTFEHVVCDDYSFKKSSVVTVTVGAGASPQAMCLRMPNGGEAYEPGQTVNIRWFTANFSGAVRLEFFDGSAWSDIANSTANDGIELWTVPVTARSNCKVRVSDAADGLPFDESDAAFKIIGSDVFKIIRFVGDSSNGPTLEWTSLPGGYSYQVFYSDTLSAGDWLPLGSPYVAQTNDYTLTYTDSTATGKLKRFYKVKQTPIE